MPPRRRLGADGTLDPRQCEREAARHEREGRFDDALATLQQVATAGLASGDVLNRCGDLHHRLDSPAEALGCWLAAAERFRADGFVHKALATLRKAARLDPARTDVLERIAAIHTAMGHVAEARRLVVDLAQRALEAGDDDRAFVLLERLLEGEPDTTTRRTLARLYEQRGRESAAVPHYVRLASDLARDGDLPAAREALERARALAPAREDVQQALGDLYAQLGLWALALPLRVALVHSASEPDLVARLHALARNHAELGATAEALETYARLHELRPDDQWLARIVLLRGRHGGIDRALDELEPVLGRLEAQGRFAQAAEWLEELLALQARHLRTLLRLAACYNRTGNKPAFRRCYEAIRDAHHERGELELELERAATGVLESSRAKLRFPRAARAAAATPAGADEASAALAAATERIRGATGLIIAAGAGLNVDYGWPDYRDPESFWTAFPEFRTLGLAMEDVARPGPFETEPARTWGFYARRQQLARDREPHAGLQALSRWRALAPAGGFVVTSCVEGEYQDAGFDAARVVECCGSIRWLQCSRECGAATFATPRRLDPRSPPCCRQCQAPARPNVLLYGDWSWDMSRLENQDARFREWLGDRRGLVLLEIGETPRLPVLRAYVRRLGEQVGASLVRISAADATVPAGGIGIHLPPRQAIEAINERLRARD